MIEWSDMMRDRDYGIFCREAMSRAKKDIIIISDIRRPNDIRWFKENYNEQQLFTIQIRTNNDVRRLRGWIYEDGVDNVQSECGLDDFNEYDFVIENDKHDVDPLQILEPLISICNS